MPIVPSTSVRSNIQSAYTVRSTSSAGALQDVGQAIGGASTRIGNSMIAKQEDTNINDAIFKASEERTKATIDHKEKTKAVDISKEDLNKSTEEYQKRIDDASTLGSENLSSEKEITAFNNWDRKDKLSRSENSASFYSSKLDSINVENTTNQMHLSQAAFAADPSKANIEVVKLAIAASAKAKNLSADATKVYVTAQKQDTINTAIDKKINDDDLLGALEFVTNAKEEMDPKTYENYVTRLDGAINDKQAVKAGKMTAERAKYIDAKTGNVLINYEQIDKEIAKLPEKQQDKARQMAISEAKHGEMVRDEQSKAVYFGLAPRVENGEINPADLPYAERSALTPERFKALETMRENYLTQGAKLDNMKATAKADANTGRVFIAISERLSNLSDADSKYAPYLLEEMLHSPDASGSLVATDIKELQKIAYARSTGESIVRNDDIMRSVSQIENKPNLINPATDEAKDWSKDPKNSGLIGYVHRNTIGIPKEQLTEKINTLVKDYSMQTRTHEKLGDVLSRGDDKEISALQLDEFSNMADPDMRKKFKELNYGKTADSLTDTSKRKLLTRAKLRGDGLIPSYQYKDGKIQAIDTQEILTGIRLEEAAEQADAPVNQFDPEANQGNMYDG